jgi:hypothetical protein
MAHLTIKLLLLLLLLLMHLLVHHVARSWRLGDLGWEPDRVHLRFHVSLLTIARVRVRDRSSRRAMARNNRWMVWRGRGLDRRIRSKLLL